MNASEDIGIYLCIALGAALAWAFVPRIKTAHIVLFFLFIFGAVVCALGGAMAAYPLWAHAPKGEGMAAFVVAGGAGMAGWAAWFIRALFSTR